MPPAFRLLPLGALVLVLAAPAAAQFGQIRGTVTDAATGETLPGVNVVIEGTTIGAATDADGRYVIIGVRPDTYTLVFSFIGYQELRVEGVRVRIDLTTTVDAALTERVLEAGEIVVTAERELIQRDLTATTAIVSADEIRALPVENFQEVVELQAGVVNGHFRGGRLGEVGFWVDGMPVQDVYDGGLALAIENSMVQEVQVVTGAFNAEFGQAMSGIVNVVTRDGGNTFEGGFMAFAGDYVTAETRLPSGAVLFPGLDGRSPLRVQNLEGNLSGPILRDRLFFFTSGRYFRNDGWIVGRNVFGFDDVVEVGGQLRRVTPPSGDSSAVPLNPYERGSGQLKLTAQLGRGIRLAANANLSQERYKDYALDRFFFPASQPLNRRDALSTYVKLTHALSNRTFYEVGVTRTYTEFRRALFDDPMDPRYRGSQYFSYADDLFTSFFRVGGTDNGRFFRSTETWLLKADLSSQVHLAHLVKTGIEVRRHTLRYRDETVVVEQQGAERVQYVQDNGRYTYHPYEIGAYVQDKIEIGDLVVNVGLRLDVFQANAPVFRDPTDPRAVFVENRLRLRNPDGTPVLGPDGRPLQRVRPDGSLDYTPDDFFRRSDLQWQLSPRLGVAFPISETGVFHFSFGRFFQRPAFERLYQNPYFQLGAGGSGLVGLVGNANLRAEQTTSGEIGLKQQLSRTSRLEVTAYYRDIRNLTGTAVAPIQVRGSGARYGQLANSDFGFVRGLILRFDQQIGRTLFAGVNYTYQVARANASDPNQSFGAAAALGLLEQRIFPTDWDQRHTLSVSLGYADPRLNAGGGLIVNYGSGTPYTPAPFVTGTGVVLPSQALVNAETKPPVVNVNLTAHKGFRLGGQEVELFTKVDNLFDTRSELDVFPETGRATYSLERNLREVAFQGDPAFLNQWYARPGFFSQPRRVVLGLRYAF